MHESKIISPPQEKKIDRGLQPKNGEVKFKDDFVDAPNLTKEQRQQLGHGCYIKKAPEFVRSKTRDLITLKGHTTSQINQALKTKNPYPARVFLKVEGQEQDTPVFFRIKSDNPVIGKYPQSLTKIEGVYWLKPHIKTGSYLEVKGFFDSSKNGSSRKSFTATSYQILTSEINQQETYAR